MKIKYSAPVDESWKLKKWYVKIGKCACYSDTFMHALFGCLTMHFPPKK